VKQRKAQKPLPLLDHRRRHASVPREVTVIVADEDADVGANVVADAARLTCRQARLQYPSRSFLKQRLRPRPRARR
jgi:hypothetical protein